MSADEKNLEASKKQQESPADNTKITDNNRSEAMQSQPASPEATVSMKAGTAQPEVESAKAETTKSALPAASVNTAEKKDAAPISSALPTKSSAASLPMPPATVMPAGAAQDTNATAVVHTPAHAAGNGGIPAPVMHPTVPFTADPSSSTLGPPLTDAEAERQIRKMSRRSFLWAAGAVVAGFSGWNWLRTRSDDSGIGWPFRRALEVNEHLSRDYFGWVKEENGVKQFRLAPEFDKSKINWMRVNPSDGGYGNNTDLDADAWRLRLIGLADMSAAVMPASEESSDTSDSSASGSGASSDSNSDSSDSASDSSDSSSEDSSDDSDEESSDPMVYQEPAVELTMQMLKTLPHFEMITEFKCIEGWSSIMRWGGVRLADLIKKYPPASNMQYVSLTTPDGEYYVGLDMDSALHPQTMLCYEMTAMDAQGNPLPDAPMQPLSSEHGAPLRLVIPVKYGIKNIKRIGTIKFTAERPRDYWAERGYDWYAGH